MGNKKYKKALKKPASAGEPIATYVTGSSKKVSIAVFNSFEELNEANAKSSALQTYDQRMENLEFLRKQVYSDYLLPDGNWQPIERVFKIMSPYVNSIS